MDRTTGRELNGRFELRDLLRRGNGVDTFAGVDRRDGAPVIVKTVASEDVPMAVRLRLEHEAQVLEGLGDAGAHPLVASGYDGSLFYLVQPRHPGDTLRSRIESGPIPVEDTLHIAAGVLRALRNAHDQGILHRDVKPENVIVDGAGPSIAAHLVDFGLARSARLDPSLRDAAVGTARYLAPEAAGLFEGGVDQRSDLYSLGVVLFECLAGRPPFGGATVGEVLRQHLSLPAPALRSLGVAVPRAVDAVVQRLLAKDPGERYQAADAVLADVDEIATALARGTEEPAVTPGLRERRAMLTEPTFIGRTDELSTLGAWLDKAAEGGPGLVLVEAESGGGKTRLLDELALQAARRDMWVLRGQGVDQAAQRPFQLFDGVARGIEAAATTDPEVALRLAGDLGDRASPVAEALPPLRGVFPVSSVTDAGPEAYGEARSTDALLRLIDVVGTGQRPAVLLLDDCQWADRLTTVLLGRWMQAARPGRHVVVVAAFRSEEVGADHPLRAMSPSATVRLRAFESADVASMCASMAGPLPDEVVDTVERLAGGSPFMVSAVLRGMVECGAVLPGEEGWTVGAGELADVQTSRRAALFLLRRFDLLSAPAATLLEIGAVLGKQFGLGLALEMTGQTPLEVATALAEARRRGIVWVDEATSTCAFAHDKLREALLERLPHERRVALHAIAADRIEQDDATRVFELAYHFHAAGAPARALPYAVSAAEAARGRYALEVAADHYRIAQDAADAAGSTDTGLRRAIAAGLADVLTLQGSYEEAGVLLQAALVMADDPIDRAVIEGKLGDVAFKCGDQVEARRHLEGALRSLGRWVPRSNVTFALAAVWEVLIQTGHTLFGRWLNGRKSLHGTETEFLALRTYSRLAYVYWFHAGRMPCAWAHLREMNRAEAYPPTPELAQAYSEHAPVMTMAPWFSRGIAYARRSYEIRRELGDLWGQGQSLGFHGVVLYAASRYEEAIEKCQEAAQLLERTGDRWEEHTARWHIAYSHYRLGDLARAVEIAREIHASAQAIGDHAAAGITLSAWAKASGGRVSAEAIADELGRDHEDAHTTTEILTAEAIRLLAIGAADEAVQRIDQAVEVVERAGLRQEYVMPVYPWLATALRTRIESTGGHAPRSLVRRARRVSRRAVRISRSYRNNLPHALRERALIADLCGQRRRARRRLERSVAVAVHQGARYEEAMSRAAACRLGIDRNGGGPSESDRILAPFEPAGGAADRSGGIDVATLSLADRFETLLVVGRRIASAPSVEAVYAAVRDAAVTLLRGDHCHVVEVSEPGADLVTESGEAIDPLSGSLVARATETRATVVSGNDDASDSSASLVLAGLRSALCSPILFEDRVVACFCVTHRQIGGLYGHAEEQLADFVAALAGAALEHVAGSEARFRSLAQNSTDVITIVDHGGSIVYQSSSVEAVFGYAVDELLGQNILGWVHDADAHLLTEYLEQSSAESQDGALLAMRLRDRDGTWRHAETAVTPMFEDPSVRGLVLNTRDVSERVALESELRIRAWHDPLTGLANRGLFADRVELALGRCSREGHPVAVAFLDLDDFKSINDTMGHGSGDILLRGVSERLLACVRPEDTVARFGGDEFAVLLEGPGAADAEAVARRVLLELERPFRILDEDVHVHASVGLAVANGDERTDELIAGADTAMYVAKARGRSRYEVFEPKMRDHAIERSGLRTDLEWALQRDELQVHYQPIVDLVDGRLTGFEALLRWNHPRRGLLPPAEFIELAEKSGLIVSIGAWVLREATRQVQQWRETFATDFVVAVNVSARQLQDPGLVGEVATALRGSGFPPGSLVLEITESATVEDTEGVIARLEQFKDLGVALAIDDFGTGYSSLSYLRRFPVDQLKVDRSFVTGLVTSQEDRAIVGSVIALAHALGLHVVAEGVETIDQFELLSQMGCDLAQGYNWARPQSSEVTADWLHRRHPDIATSPAAVRVLIADDRTVVRAALRIALEADARFVVVGEAASGAETVALAGELNPEMILLDVTMTPTNGIDVIPDLRRCVPRAVIVLLTAMDRQDVLAHGGDAADHWLDKTSDLAHVVDELVATGVARGLR